MNFYTGYIVILLHLIHSNLVNSINNEKNSLVKNIDNSFLYSKGLWNNVNEHTFPIGDSLLQVSSGVNLSTDDSNGGNKNSGNNGSEGANQNDSDNAGTGGGNPDGQDTTGTGGRSDSNPFGEWAAMLDAKYDSKAQDGSTDDMEYENEKPEPLPLPSVPHSRRSSVTVSSFDPLKGSTATEEEGKVEEEIFSKTDDPTHKKKPLDGSLSADLTLQSHDTEDSDYTPHDMGHRTSIPTSNIPMDLSFGKTFPKEGTHGSDGTYKHDTPSSYDSDDSGGDGYDVRHHISSSSPDIHKHKTPLGTFPRKNLHGLGSTSPKKSDWSTPSGWKEEDSIILEAKKISEQIKKKHDEDKKELKKEDQQKGDGKVESSKSKGSDKVSDEKDDKRKSDDDSDKGDGKKGKKTDGDDGKKKPEKKKGKMAGFYSKMRKGFNKLTSYFKKKKEKEPEKKPEKPKVVFTSDQNVKNVKDTAKTLNIEHTYKPKESVTLAKCEKFIVGKVREFIDFIKKDVSNDAYSKEQQVKFDQCMEAANLLDKQNTKHSTITNRARGSEAILGRFGPFKLNQGIFIEDLLKYTPDMDYIPFAEDINVLDKEWDKANFCLVNPGSLSKFLKSKVFRNSFPSRREYNSEYKRHLWRSLSCYIENLYQGVFEKHLSKGENINLVFTFRKEVRAKLDIITRGLNHSDRKFAEHIFKGVVRSADTDVKLRHIFIHLQELVTYFSQRAFQGMCDAIVSTPHFYPRLELLYKTVTPVVQYYNACMDNLVLYSQVLSNIHKGIKQVYKLVSREKALKQEHFDALLSKKKKNEKKDDRYDLPSVKNFAYRGVERISIVQLINDFFETRKEALLEINSRMKIELAAHIRDDVSNVTKKKDKSWKAGEKIRKKYRSEVEKFLKKVKEDYIKLLKIRYNNHMQRNYFIFHKRLF